MRTRLATTVLSLLLSLPVNAETGRLTVHVDKPSHAVSPILYGLMTEEINHSYEGGIYAELIQNRSFKDDSNSPAHWSLVGPSTAGSIVLDPQTSLTSAQNVSLKLTATTASTTAPVGVANEGYWGIPVKPNTKYRASFWAKSTSGYSGPLSVRLETADGSTTWAKANVGPVTGVWKQYSVQLRTGKNITPSTANRFTISLSAPGTVNLDLVSLFPPTYHNRPNGNRIDIMEKLAAMHPSFLRLPGGNFVEGYNLETRYDFKHTIGALTDRPGHQGCWGYRSNDGLGFLEYLEWCEDLHMEPVLAVFAGYALSGEHVTGDALKPYVQDALDEIEYVTGESSTTWGARRITDGHAKPFPLTYVEIGNEDGFDKSGSYDERFAAFFDAIKAKYPALKLIATASVKSRKPDVVDDHYYRRSPEMYADVDHYRNRPADSTKVFVGEWATTNIIPWSPEGRKAPPTPELEAALSDAAWMIGMERDSDTVVMECYAPLFVNVNPGARQWAPDLIGYDAINSFGSPPYYAQVMFSGNRGDVVLPVDLDIPAGSDAKPVVFATASRQNASGDVIIKVVNTLATTEPVTIDLDGATDVAKTGTLIQLSGDLDARNSIDEPMKVAPVSLSIPAGSPNFSLTLAPHSVNVVRVKVK